MDCDCSCIPSFRRLQWQNSGSTGGIVISFTDGTDTRSLGIRDQNGEMLSASSMINQWDYRIASLSSVAGKTISQVRLYTDGATAAGQWDLYFQDLVFTGGESTIIPLFSQNATAPGMTGSGTAGVTSTVANIHDCVGTGCSPVNTTMYFHDDQIGSARLLSAGYGYPVWQGTFTPFGQEVSPEITTNHFKFSGKERGEAAEGSLDYFGARYYSSTMGRWMTPDWNAAPTPIPYAKLTDPQTLNLYGYVGDDPLSHTDVDGHARHHIGCPEGETCPHVALTASHKCAMGMTTYCQEADDHGNQGQNQSLGDRWARKSAELNKKIDKYLGRWYQALANVLDLLQPCAPTVSCGVVFPVEGLAEAASGGSSAADAVRLGKQLASEMQMTEAGVPIAGAGTGSVLRDANRLVAQYGGNVSDWSKMTSTAFKAGDGSVVQTHWYQNDVLGERVEYKTIYIPVLPH